MRKAYNAAHVYMILGVVSGLYYRELTKANDFHGETQLGVVHTHLLALGMLVFLIVLALDKQFGLSGDRLFTHFFRFSTRASRSPSRRCCSAAPRPSSVTTSPKPSPS